MFLDIFHADGSKSLKQTLVAAQQIFDCCVDSEEQQVYNSYSQFTKLSKFMLLTM